MSGIEMSRRACAVSQLRESIVWSTRNICCANSMMVYVCAVALAVSLREKCTVVRVCR
jgi:hypothetical protein